MLSDLISKSSQEVSAEGFQFAIRSIITPELRDCIRFSDRVGRNEADYNIALNMVATFMKKLVKNEEILNGESKVIRKIEKYHHQDVPIRPVDHLIEFVLAYWPKHRWFTPSFMWLRMRQRRSIIKLPITTVTKTVIDKQTVNHYHCIPWSLKNSGHEARFLLWGGEYYDGTPEEWGDLKEMRDYIMAGFLGRGFPVADRYVEAYEHWSRVADMAYKSSMKSRKYGG